MRRRLNLEEVWALSQIADPIVPFALRCAAELGLADHLDAPLSAKDLARRLELEPEALLSLLRTLAGRGVFSETSPGTFENTRMSRLLRSDHPLGARDALPLLPADADAWAFVDHSIRTGGSAFEHVHGKSYYDWLADHPETGAKVDRSVDAVAGFVARTLSGVLPWGELGTMVDIGSGTGRFTLTLMSRHPALRAVLFDRSWVTPAAQQLVDGLGMTDRVAVVEGDYFEAVPSGFPTYLLKSVLHDWTDAPALKLLSRVRQAMPPDGTLLVIEAILEPDNAFDFGKLMDLSSLVLAGAPDRSPDQLEALLERAGFEIRAWHPTGHALRVIEAAKCT